MAGKVLPIELLSAPIIPFRVTIQNDKVLVLCVRENFDLNTFRRVVGLSQTLTLGWCNKICICFPDYDLVKHMSVKQAVLTAFSENGFADMIEVKNYKNSYINLQNDKQVTFKAPIKNESVFTVETMLPCGDSLRQLLTQSYISKNELFELLSLRGVFLSKTFDKDEIIPYLSKSIISPNEFEFLRRKQSQASGQSKGRTSTTYFDKNVIEDIPQVVKLAEPFIKKKLIGKFPNSPLAKALTIEASQDGEVKVSFEINNKNLSKDWTSVESLHKGELIFTNGKLKGDTPKTNILSSAESPESRQVAKVIEREVVQQLKKIGVIPQKEKPSKILFSDFSRVLRNKFLFSFLNEQVAISLKFSQLKNIDFTIDEDAEFMSEELISLKNRMDELVVSGRNLEQIAFITDKTYQETLVFYTFLAEYNFDYMLGDDLIQGKVEIEFGFFNMRNKTVESANRTEFESEIKHLTPFLFKSLSDKNHQLLTLMIKEDIEKIKLSSTKQYCSTFQLSLFE